MVILPLVVAVSRVLVVSLVALVTIVAVIAVVAIVAVMAIMTLIIVVTIVTVVIFVAFITFIAVVKCHLADDLMQKASCKLYCMDCLAESHYAIILYNYIVRIVLCNLYYANDSIQIYRINSIVLIPP